MKTLLSLARTLPIVAAIGISATLVVEPASAARAGGGGGRVSAARAGGWHGGHSWHGGPGGPGGPGHFRGGWGHRGYWPGAFWGGIGLGLGIGAVGYYGGYYGPYYRAYYYDPPLLAAPVYDAVEPGAPRTGQPVPQAPGAPDPIFYPKNGQGAEAIESDRRECNRWATTQAGAMADASIFQRATFACMEGRGYTIR